MNEASKVGKVTNKHKFRERMILSREREKNTSKNTELCMDEKIVISGRLGQIRETGR